MEDDYMPKVSIILPAYNEQDEILSALNEMVNQTYEDREIFVVDDGSTDLTLNKALEFAKEHPDVRVVQSEHKGPSHARNAGVLESSGEIIFFGECDCVYDKEYVKKAVECLKDMPDAGAVCLTGGPLKLKSNLATNSIEIENAVQHELLKKGKIEPFYAWVFRRMAFEKVGGFDEKLFQAEDRDLFSRIVRAGYGIGWVPGINWRHKRSESIRELSRKWFTRGRMRVLFSIKHRSFADLGRELLPLWLLILGIILLPIIWEIGALLIIIVLASFLIRAIRISSIAWPVIQSKRNFLGYPIFLAIRNLSTGLAYSYGLVNVLILKAERKEISYHDV